MIIPAKIPVSSPEKESGVSLFKISEWPIGFHVNWLFRKTIKSPAPVDFILKTVISGSFSLAISR